MKHLKYCVVLFFISIAMYFPHPVSASCAIKSIGDANISSSVCSIDSNTIEGADIAVTESSTTNTAILTITNTSITINTNAGLIAGTVNLVGTSTISVLQSNTFIKTGGIWIADADADGWASSVTTLYDATASGRRRLGLMRSLVTADCNDTNDYRVNNTCCSTGTYYVDTDGDGYGAGSPINMCPAAGYVANNTDCGPTSALAYPGSATCSGTSFLNALGQSSWDWNCSQSGILNGGTKCGTILNRSSTPTWVSSNHGTGSCTNRNAKCVNNSANIYTAITSTCGQLAATCTSSAPFEHGCPGCGGWDSNPTECFAISAATAQTCQ